MRPPSINLFFIILKRKGRKGLTLHNHSFDYGVPTQSIGKETRLFRAFAY